MLLKERPPVLKTLLYLDDRTLLAATGLAGLALVPLLWLVCSTIGCLLKLNHFSETFRHSSKGSEAKVSKGDRSGCDIQKLILLGHTRDTQQTPPSSAESCCLLCEVPVGSEKPGACRALKSGSRRIGLMVVMLVEKGCSCPGIWSSWPNKLTVMMSLLCREGFYLTPLPNQDHHSRACPHSPLPPLSQPTS